MITIQEIKDFYLQNYCKEMGSISPYICMELKYISFEDERIEIKYIVKHPETNKYYEFYISDINEYNISDVSSIVIQDIEEVEVMEDKEEIYDVKNETKLTDIPFSTQDMIDMYNSLIEYEEYDFNETYNVIEDYIDSIELGAMVKHMIVAEEDSERAFKIVVSNISTSFPNDTTSLEFEVYESKMIESDIILYNSL